MIRLTMNVKNGQTISGFVLAEPHQKTWSMTLENSRSARKSFTNITHYANFFITVSLWIYFFLSVHVSDSRVKQLPLMNTPIPTAVFIICYLAWVVVIGPLYMRDRKPFSLRNTLIYYNAFQVLLSAYMFYEVTQPSSLILWSSLICHFVLASYVRLVEGLQLHMRDSWLLRRSTVETGKLT